MRQTALILAGIVSIASIGLAGCDVKKTQEGKVDLPKYDVEAPKVDVTTEKKEVNVPKVGVYTEKEKLTVPKVSITPAKDRDDKVASKNEDAKK